MSGTNGESKGEKVSALLQQQLFVTTDNVTTMRAEMALLADVVAKMVKRIDAVEKLLIGRETHSLD